jgi:hypothetical protein
MRFADVAFVEQALLDSVSASASEFSWTNIGTPASRQAPPSLQPGPAGRHRLLADDRMPQAAASFVKVGWVSTSVMMSMKSV